jgi:hypothetical protein
MELSPEDEKKLKRAIAAGSILAGVYFFDQVTADEWYEKDDKDKFVVKRRTIIEEIFE